MDTYLQYICWFNQYVFRVYMFKEYTFSILVIETQLKLSFYDYFPAGPQWLKCENLKIEGK